MKKLLSIIFIAISTVAFSQISMSSTVTNVSCFGLCDGSASVTTTGGTAPYTYTWTPNFANTSSASNLCAGIYSVTVMDAMALTVTQTINISQPAQLTTVISSINSNCGQANGNSCSTASGGTPPLSYLWSNGVTTLCNSNIVAGAYTFTVTDANNCIAVSSGLVNDVAGVTVSISSQTNISCFGLCNGAITPSVFGGVAPYVYSWSNGATTPSLTNLCSGINSLIVTDNAGCIGSASVNIIQPTQLTASAVVQNSLTCSTNCNGTASISVNGGTAPYTYNWNNGSTLAWVQNLCAGVYVATVTDMKGCSTTQSVVITSPPPITITTTVTNATCMNSCNGTSSATVTGGLPSYTYTWTTSAPPLGSGGNTPNINGACAGTYTLIVNDAMGCSQGALITVGFLSNNSIPNTTITSVSYNETCLLSGDGAIDLSIAGTNTGPFSYQWNNGANTQDITNIISNIYYVDITDGIGNCFTLSDTITSIGTNCGTISGNVYIDNNSDCANNTGDNNLNGAIVMVNPGNRLGYTNLNGDYMINNLPYATYSVTSNANNINLASTCTTTLISNVNAGMPNSINNNFSKEIVPAAQPDLYVSGYSNGIVPGFICTVHYYLNNYNNNSAAGIYKVTLPSAFIPNITQVSPAIYTLSGDTIIWNFSNITSSSSTNFFVKFTTPLSTPLSSIFTTCMWAQPTVTDLDYVNNNYCYSRTVYGSFDPNDKTVSPVGVGPNGDIAATETDLTYLIRFQNTGNGPAVNIVVKDTLSTNVDVTTFEMLGSSHNYNIDILPGNVLRWKFNNIMLADSGSNEAASHGYIQYRIKRTNNNTPGTQIKNTAYIYFDFNAPVITNTAINTIETVTSVKSQLTNENGWNVYPNPSTGALYIVNSTTVKEESQIQVLNAIGQTVFEETITSNYKNIDLSKLTNGIYFVKITSDKSSTVKRVVLSK